MKPLMGSQNKWVEVLEDGTVGWCASVVTHEEGHKAYEEAEGRESEMPNGMGRPPFLFLGILSVMRLFSG